MNGVSESAISMSVSSHADDHSQQHIPEASVATNVDNKFAGQDEGLPLWKQVLLRKRANEPKVRERNNVCVCVCVCVCMRTCTCM